MVTSKVSFRVLKNTINFTLSHWLCFDKLHVNHHFVLKKSASIIFFNLCCHCLVCRGTAATLISFYPLLYSNIYCVPWIENVKSFFFFYFNQPSKYSQGKKKHEFGKQSDCTAELNRLRPSMTFTCSITTAINLWFSLILSLTSNLFCASTSLSGCHNVVHIYIRVKLHFHNLRLREQTVTVNWL